MRQKLLFLLTAALLLLIGSVPVGADTPNGAKFIWPPIPVFQGDQMNSPLLGYHFGIVDDFTQGGNADSVSFISVAGSVQPLCSGFSDPVCQREFAKVNGWWANAVLPPCSTVSGDVPCVEGVAIMDSTGKRELKLKQILSGPTWNADPNHGSIPGSAPSLWIDPNEIDSAQGYKVTASGALSFGSSSSSPTVSFLTSFQSSITAYKEVSGNYDGYKPTVNPDGVTHVGFGGGPGCIWSEKGVCGIQTEFKNGSRLQLRVHLPFGLGSWLIGRISDPNISIESIAGQPRLQRISIDANPVLVPMFAVDVPIDKATQTFKDAYRQAGLCNVFPQCNHGYAGGNTAASFPSAFQGFEIFHDYWNQKANILIPTWSVRTLLNQNTLFSSNCGFGSTVLNGVVTTNASIYEGNPPTWDGTSLTYKVAGLHLDPDGNVFQGSYDLIINSQYARCLYKFSNAPISATVSVIDDQGSNSVATTSFQEKDGWIHLAARGFTFSSPTLKVVLEQAKPTPTPTPTLTPTPTPTVAEVLNSSSPQPSVRATKKTITISCTKGRTVKYLTGANPKCPLGYSQKIKK